MSTTSGPAYKPEKAVGRSYPKPKKGTKLDCLACKDGKVLAKGGIRNCKACEGKGYLVVK
jgi:hypothetical protein